MIVSIENAEHYVWGEVCDGWHLIKREELSVIQERVPAGAAEVMHYHHHARQFFYILAGEATIVYEDQKVRLQQGDGVEIGPRVKHQFKNRFDVNVFFLVISVPSTRSDRVIYNSL